MRRAAMKLYDLKTGTNTRRVRIFLAEKGVKLPTVEVDMMKGNWPSVIPFGLRLAPALPGCALTAPSTARGSSGSDDVCIVGPRQLEGASFSQHRPGDAGKLVGERDRQHVVVQPPLGGFDPGFEPITSPVLYPDQHNPCRLHKQNAQVAIAAPRDFAEDRAVSRRDLTS